jgi:hypothetical protein
MRVLCFEQLAGGSNPWNLRLKNWKVWEEGRRLATTAPPRTTGRPPSNGLCVSHSRYRDYHMVIYKLIDDQRTQRFRNRDWKCREARRLGPAEIPRQFLANVWEPEYVRRGVCSFAPNGVEKDSPFVVVRERRGIAGRNKDLFSGGTRCEVSAGLAIDLGGHELSPEGLRLGAAQLRFDIACQESMEQVVGQEGQQSKGLDRLRRGQAECARPLYELTPVPGFRSLRLRSLHGFPALWQHIEC